MSSKANQSTFHTRDWSYSAHVDRPNYGVLLKDVLEDSYWSNVAAKLKVGDQIEIQPEGLTYYAKLIVVDCGPAFAKVKVLAFNDLTDERAAPDQEPLQTSVALGVKYVAERAGPWFRVKRVPDNEIMKTGFRSMKAAEAWAAENLNIAA